VSAYDRFMATLSAEQDALYLELEREQSERADHDHVAFLDELVRHLPAGLTSLVWLLIGHLNSQQPDMIGICCADQPPVL
jgi:hypothetical protein